MSDDPAKPTMVSELIRMLQAFESQYGDMPVAAKGFDRVTARLLVSPTPNFDDGGCLYPLGRSSHHISHWIRSRTHGGWRNFCRIHADEPMEDGDSIDGVVIEEDEQ